MVNKIIIIGRVGKDASLRYTPSGVANASFSVATSESWKDKENKKQEKTEWHNVIAWRKLAEICGEYVTKGMLVYIEGKITYRSYEDKGGVKHDITEIVADTMKMLGGGKAKQEKEQIQPPDKSIGGIGNEDDCPF
ncbi:MAG: single-stranded DNA-binding protein [Candidatus Methanoperedens sp.]|nr:single-stranded DNA-binding protein [Candidatus Methanoperedens sp.]